MGDFFVVLDLLSRTGIGMTSAAFSYVRRFPVDSLGLNSMTFGIVVSVGCVPGLIRHGRGNLPAKSPPIIVNKVLTLLYVRTQKPPF